VGRGRGRRWAFAVLMGIILGRRSARIDGPL
jgi:hypothetical protein